MDWVMVLVVGLLLLAAMLIGAFVALCVNEKWMRWQDGQEFGDMDDPLLRPLDAAINDDQAVEMTDAQREAAERKDKEEAQWAAIMTYDGSDQREKRKPEDDAAEAEGDLTDG